LLSVPGNHDLQRPDARKPEVRTLARWGEEPDVIQEFWEESENPYRVIVDTAFSNYVAWSKRAKRPRPEVYSPGILPGDFAATIEKDGFKLGVAGLNSAYLQLADGDYKDRLDLDVRQLHLACGGDSPAWAREHHLCLLMTHHPPDWLRPKALRDLQGEITTPKRFAAHLFGHMHTGATRVLSNGGAAPMRTWQAASLFGLEHFGTAKEERSHGYSAVRLTIEERGALVRTWPRAAIRCPDGARRLIPDHYNYHLEDDHGTGPEALSVRTSSHESVPASAPSSPRPTPVPNSAARTILARGEILSELVDAAFLVQSGGMDDLEQIRRHVRVGTYLTSRFLYSSDRGASRWLELCSDPEYTTYASSKGFIDANRDRILDACGHEFLRTSPDYVSLGPGNGRKDKSLLSALLRRTSEPVYYYPLDISLLMLSRATQTMAMDRELRSRLKIKAIYSDFSDLQLLLPVFDFRNAPNLFVFLGNTLGNMQHEEEFLGKLHSAMRAGDVLILEVRLTCGEDNVAGGADELRWRFNFTPLETIGVPYDHRKVKFRVISNASHIPGTRTVVGEYLEHQLPGSDEIYTTRLTYIHHYQSSEIASALRARGFDIKGQFSNDRTAIFVLAKKS
jgi:hypothetical protein